MAQVEFIRAPSRADWPQQLLRLPLPQHVYVAYPSPGEGVWVLKCSLNDPYVADPFLSWANEGDDEVDISEIDLFRHQPLLPFVTARSSCSTYRPEDMFR